MYLQGEKVVLPSEERLRPGGRELQPSLHMNGRNLLRKRGGILFRCREKKREGGEVLCLQRESLFFNEKAAMSREWGEKKSYVRGKRGIFITRQTRKLKESK